MKSQISTFRPLLNIDSGVLEIRNIQKHFGSQTALESIDLTIREGEFFSLLGPSGCGKSTLLRILAGLEEASAGEILWKGQRIDQWPARQRPFNMVFQKYALFPHLNVFENVAFALRLKRSNAAEVKAQVTEALALVNLLGFESRSPETLSGGQAQRVAIARALVNRPSILLLDEPLGALDQKLREHMQTELRLLQKRLGLTFILVTHDQEEAMILSDRVAVMNAGRLEQVSAPRELFEKPSSLFSARFIGSRNELPARATSRENRWHSLEVEGGGAIKGISACAELDRAGSGRVRAFIRPERLKVIVRGASSSVGLNTLQGEVVQVLFRGLSSEVILNVGSVTLKSLVDAETASKLSPGDRVGVEFSPEETHLFATDTQ